jgi:RecA/RadA recombinase
MMLEQVQERGTFSTGCDLLDLVVGGGLRYGYRIGSIINIVGDSSSGKTFLACELIAAAYHRLKDKLKWVYDDAESGFTFDTERLYGFKVLPDEEDRVKSETVEEWYCHVREFAESLKEDEKGIYVLDTLDGLSSRQIQERGDERFKAYKKDKKFEKGSYQMDSAKFLSQEFFKNLTGLIEQKNILLVIISQTRDDINSMFNTQTRAGGKALNFYAHTCLWLYKSQGITAKGIAVGEVVKAKTKKSKTPRPFRSCYFPLIFDYGLDNVGSNVDFLFDLRTPEGDMRGSSESLRWTDGGKEMTPKSIVEFIKEHGKEDVYRQVKKDRGGMTGVKALTEWISSDEELSHAFEDEFGIAMKRKDLIDWIEKNSKQEELTRRVREKWEKIEQEIRSTRPKKYA